MRLFHIRQTVDKIRIQIAVVNNIISIIIQYAVDIAKNVCCLVKCKEVFENIDVQDAA